MHVKPDARALQAIAVHGHDDCMKQSNIRVAEPSCDLGQRILHACMLDTAQASSAAHHGRR